MAVLGDFPRRGLGTLTSSGGHTAGQEDRPPAGVTRVCWSGS